MKTVMGSFRVRIPESLHQKLKELAKKEGVSMNQLVTLAVSEKMSSLLTVDYLRERAERADRKTFENILKQVMGDEPEEQDKL